MEVLNKEKVLENAKRLIDEGKIDKAILEYRKLLDIDPKDMRLKIRIAELLVKQKKISDAIKMYREVADAYTEEGFYLKAVTVYKNVLRLNPSLMETNSALAELYEKMGLNKDAIHQYQIVANTLENKGDYNTLINIRKKMVQLDPHNIAARIRLAETFQYQGLEEESLNEYEMLVEEVKGAGTPEQLIDLYEKILSYRSDNLEMIRALSKIYYQQRDWKKVVLKLEKAKELIEGQNDLILMQADVYTRLNQIETAKGKYKEVAENFMQSGEVDRALDAYREILVISPDVKEDVKKLVDTIDPQLFDKISAEAEEKRNKIAEMEAAAEAEKEAASMQEEVAGSEAGIVGQEQVGQMSKEKGERAVEKEKVDVQIKIREAGAAYELGKAYYQMGLKSEAELELSKALSLYREILGQGYKNEKVTENMINIEKWLGIRKEVKAEAKESTPASPPLQRARAAEVEEKQVTVQPKEKLPEVKKKEKTEEKPKKKDKRMGFV